MQTYTHQRFARCGICLQEVVGKFFYLLVELFGKTEQLTLFLILYLCKYA